MLILVLQLVKLLRLQILPQAICTRYGLTVGATVAPFVQLLLWAFFPIAYPISKVHLMCMRCFIYSTGQISVC